MFLRLVLPVRAGMFGPDESFFALEAQSILKGDSFPLIFPGGHFGIYYGTYHYYYLALIHGITRFNLGWSLFISSIVQMSAAFLLASYTTKRYSIWTFLLALTAPLAIHFSMSVWIIELFIPLSALVLYLGRQASPRGAGKEFLIGLLLGAGVGIHLQIVPFVAGIAAWRILVTRRIASILSLLAGISIAVTPYAIGLWQVRGELNFTPTSPIYPFEPGLFGFSVFLSSLFRFFGAHSHVHMFPPGGWLSGIEERLAQLTLGITISILLIGVYYLWKMGRKHLTMESPLVPFVLCATAYLPFAYFSNTGFQPHNGMALWWFAPLVIPPVIMAALPGRAAIIALQLLIVFNLVVVAIEYTPRSIYGTQASFAYGMGPSWWAYEEAASTICAEVNGQFPSQDMTIVEMAGDPRDEPIRFVLANLIKLKHPDCAQRVQLIWSVSTPGRVLRFEPAPDNIHRRVVWVTR